MLGCDSVAGNAFGFALDRVPGSDYIPESDCIPEVDGDRSLGLDCGRSLEVEFDRSLELLLLPEP